MDGKTRQKKKSLDHYMMVFVSERPLANFRHLLLKDFREFSTFYWVDIVLHR
jgi:hypothetical protein